MRVVGLIWTLGIGLRPSSNSGGEKQLAHGDDFHSQPLWAAIELMMLRLKVLSHQQS